MRKPIFVLICFFSFCKLSAQLNTFNRQFVQPHNYNPNTAGYEFNNLNQTKDKGYFTSRSIFDSVNATGYVYCELIKTDKTGNPMWMKRILNGTFQNYFALTGNNVISTIDDGYFVVTETLTASNKQEIIAIKMDNSGNPTWSKKYSGEGTSTAYCARQTTDRGYVICGTTTNSMNKHFAYIFKIDSLGNYTWGQKCLPAADTNAVFYNVVELQEIGYVVSGRSNEKAVTVRFDLNGNMIWNSCLFSQRSTFYSLIKASDNSIICIGSYRDTLIGKLRLYLVKYDTAGNILWSKGYNQVPSNYYGSEGWSLKELHNGLVFCGWIMDPIPGVVIGKLDLNGNYSWSKKYWYTMEVFSDAPLSIIATTDSGFAVSGLVGITFRGNQVLCTELLKTDSSGYAGCDGVNYPIPLTDLNDVPVNTVLASSSGSGVSYIATIINSTSLDTIRCENINDPVGIKENNGGSFGLLQNHPNPFHDKTNITYTLSGEPGTVLFEVYDIFGSKKTEQRSPNVAPGTYEIEFERNTLPSGIYFYSMQANGIKTVKKMVIE